MLQAVRLIWDCRSEGSPTKDQTTTNMYRILDAMRTVTYMMCLQQSLSAARVGSVRGTRIGYGHIFIRCTPHIREKQYSVNVTVKMYVEKSHCRNVHLKHQPVKDSVALPQISHGSCTYSTDSGKAVRKISDCQPSTEKGHFSENM